MDIKELTGNKPIQNQPESPKEEKKNKRASWLFGRSTLQTMSDRESSDVPKIETEEKITLTARGAVNQKKAQKNRYSKFYFRRKKTEKKEVSKRESMKQAKRQTLENTEMNEEYKKAVDEIIQKKEERVLRPVYSRETEPSGDSTIPQKKETVNTSTSPKDSPPKLHRTDSLTPQEYQTFCGLPPRSPERKKTQKSREEEKQKPEENLLAIRNQTETPHPLTQRSLSDLPLETMEISDEEFNENSKQTQYPLTQRSLSDLVPELVDGVDSPEENYETIISTKKYVFLDKSPPRKREEQKLQQPGDTKEEKPVLRRTSSHKEEPTETPAQKCEFVRKYSPKPSENKKIAEQFFAEEKAQLKREFSSHEKKQEEIPSPTATPKTSIDSPGRKAKKKSQKQQKKELITPTFECLIKQYIDLDDVKKDFDSIYEHFKNIYNLKKSISWSDVNSKIIEIMSPSTPLTREQKLKLCRIVRNIYLHQKTAFTNVWDSNFNLYN